MKQNQQLSDLIVGRIIVLTVSHYRKDNENVGIAVNPDGRVFFHAEDARPIEADTKYPKFVDCRVPLPAPQSKIVVKADEIEFRAKGQFGRGYYATRWGLRSEYVDAQNAIASAGKCKPAPAVPVPMSLKMSSGKVIPFPTLVRNEQGSALEQLIAQHA